jgi:hypothetical protein
MARVNSRGENRPSERASTSALLYQGQHPLAENGAIPAPQRSHRPAERLSALAILADGKDSNSRYLIGPKLPGCGSFRQQAYVAKSLIL